MRQFATPEPTLGAQQECRLAQQLVDEQAQKWGTTDEEKQLLQRFGAHLLAKYRRIRFGDNGSS